MKNLICALLCFVVLFSVASCAVIKKDVTAFDTSPIYAGNSALLSQNPDRGFRLEAFLNPSDYTGYPGTQRESDASSLLDEVYNEYKDDSPKLIQTYIYLIDYYNKPLDETAISNIEKYFDHVAALGLKALVVFAYEYDASMNIGPTTEQILEHISQLKDVMSRRRDVLHSWQVGFIGLWGEGHNSVYPHDTASILKALLSACPSDLFLQARTTSTKFSLGRVNEAYSRIGYADLYLTGTDNIWSISETPGSLAEYLVKKDVGKVLIDGEMPWGVDEALIKSEDIDGVLMAKRLRNQCFTSLSVVHNYKEGGSFFAMSRWQNEQVTPTLLAENDLPYYDSWFYNSDGTSVSRSVYDYIRDYIGYAIMANGISLEKSESGQCLNVSLFNYGTCAPLAMKKIEVLLFDENDNVLQANELCNVSELTSGEHLFKLELDGISVQKVGIRLTNSAGEAARLLNSCDFIDGVNVFERQSL